jgi:hypothetical protein
LALHELLGEPTSNSTNNDGCDPAAVTFELGGPHIYSYEELLRAVAREASVEARPASRRRRQRFINTRCPTVVRNPSGVEARTMLRS